VPRGGTIKINDLVENAKSLFIYSYKLATS